MDPRGKVPWSRGITTELEKSRLQAVTMHKTSQETTKVPARPCLTGTFNWWR